MPVVLHFLPPEQSEESQQSATQLPAHSLSKGAWQVQALPTHCLWLPALQSPATQHS